MQRRPGIKPRPDFSQFPVSQGQRSGYLADLITQVGELAIHANTALPMALATPLSAVRDFFESNAFANYRKSLESRQKLSLAILQRFESVIKSMGGLGKLLAGRR